MVSHAPACFRHSKSWNEKKTIYMFSQIFCFLFLLYKCQKRISWWWPSRFRFRTSPCYLMVVLLPSWGKNKCRALYNNDMEFWIVIYFCTRDSLRQWINGCYTTLEILKFCINPLALWNSNSYFKEIILKQILVINILNISFHIVI